MSGRSRMVSCDWARMRLALSRLRAGVEAGVGVVGAVVEAEAVAGAEAETEEAAEAEAEEGAEEGVEGEASGDMHAHSALSPHRLRVCIMNVDRILYNVLHTAYKAYYHILIHVSLRRTVLSSCLPANREIVHASSGVSVIIIPVVISVSASFVPSPASASSVVIIVVRATATRARVPAGESRRPCCPAQGQGILTVVAGSSSALLGGSRGRARARAHPGCTLAACRGRYAPSWSGGRSGRARPAGWSG